MRKLSELDDDVLLQEYRHSIKGLMKLDPTLPKGMHEIRAKYRDYLGEELAARGLLAPDSKHQGNTLSRPATPIRHLRREESLHKSQESPD